MKVINHGIINCCLFFILLTFPQYQSVAGKKAYPVTSAEKKEYLRHSKERVAISIDYLDKDKIVYDSSMSALQKKYKRLERMVLKLSHK